MRPIFPLAAALLPLYANAFSPSGLRFEHHEWELACDNTGTCRAAGYSADGVASLPVSVWRLSDKGAAAVLLKMDEYQGRIGTAGPLLKKGIKPESSVPAASPVPVIIRAAYAKPRPGDERFIPANREALRLALRATVKNENCGDLEEEGEQRPELNAQRLSANQKNRKSANDHWESRTFTWDGKRFVVSEESVTGTGRSIKAGGGWTLPTVVTAVR